MRVAALTIALGGVFVASACSAVSSTTLATGGGSTGTSMGSSSTTTSGLGGFLGTGTTGPSSCADDLAKSALGADGSTGCAFWAADPPFYDNGTKFSSYSGPCYAVFVINTWDRPAKLTVERDGKSFDVTTFGRIPKGVLPGVTYEPIPDTGIPRDEVAILFLSHRPGTHHGDTGSSLECPIPPAVLEDAAVPGSGRGSAFHIVSDTPISAYDILPYGGASSVFPSASLLLPQSAWGTNHVTLVPPSGSIGKPWLAIVGTTAGTTVTLAPGETLLGGPGLPDVPAGTATQITLGAGEIAQWMGVDPTRTIIDATQPIGVLSGSTALRMPSLESPGGGGMDSAHLQIPPIQALGSDYVAGGIVSRLLSNEPESVAYQLMGVVDGTALTYDPPLDEAPAQLAAGEVALIRTSGTFHVRSQDAGHPFLLAQIMPGAPHESASKADCIPTPGLPSTACNLGDEDWVNLPAVPQLLRRYVFFVDPSYGTTNLVITRARGPSGFDDVTIDCLGGPVSGWQDVGTEGRYQVAHVDLVRRTIPVGNCSGSRVAADSASPFGVMVWGTDRWASYGYPAGGSGARINEVIVKIPH